MLAEVSLHDVPVRLVLRHDVALTDLGVEREEKDPSHSPGLEVVAGKRRPLRAPQCGVARVRRNHDDHLPFGSGIAAVAVDHVPADKITSLGWSFPIRHSPRFRCIASYGPVCLASW